MCSPIAATAQAQGVDKSWRDRAFAESFALPTCTDASGPPAVFDEALQVRHKECEVLEIPPGLQTLGGVGVTIFSCGDPTCPLLQIRSLWFLPEESDRDLILSLRIEPSQPYRLVANTE